MSPSNKLWEFGTVDGKWWETATTKAPYSDGVVEAVCLPQRRLEATVNTRHIVWWKEVLPNG